MTFRFLFFIAILGSVSKSFGQTVNKELINNTMLKEKLISIYAPASDSGWTYIQTDVGFYEIRVGGFLKVEKMSDEELSMNSCPKIGLEVIETWTDGETVYIVLSDNSFISLGFSEIDSEGKLHRSIYYLSFDDLDEDERDFEKDPLMKRL